jgi:hypothetical protein
MLPRQFIVVGGFSYVVCELLLLLVKLLLTPVLDALVHCVGRNAQIIDEAGTSINQVPPITLDKNCF